MKMASSFPIVKKLQEKSLRITYAYRDAIRADENSLTKIGRPTK